MMPPSPPLRPRARTASVNRATTSDIGSSAPSCSTPTVSFMYVANQGDDSVSQIDPSANEAVGGPIAVGGEPRGVDGGEGLIWVVNSESDTVSRIDP